MIALLSGADLGMTAAFALLPLVLAAALALLLNEAARRERVTRRIQDVRRGQSTSTISGQGVATRMVHGISNFGQLVARSGVLSGKALDGIRQQLASAGLRGGNAVGLFLGSKLILVALLPTLAITMLPAETMSGALGKLLVAAAGVAGLLTPEWLLRWQKGRYTKALEAGLPDMLDMLVMCTEAGLSLDPSLARVGQEIVAIHPVIARELALTTAELQVLADSRMALTNMGERSGVTGLRRLASTLIQTLQYGTPLAPSLRALTTEMRTEMLTGFEERAGRLPALLTLIMILFILPSLFMTVGGPAILEVIRQFGS